MSLSKLLAVGERELIALVGGGGKSTMMFGLGDELAAAGKRVVMTTTTKMGRYQTEAIPNLCRSADTNSVNAALKSPGPVMLITDSDDHKVTGPPPEVVDRLFSESDADHIVVEADGSHGRPLKAPAAHEPVVPSLSTMVVILMGIDAVGSPLGEVTHRVDVAMRFTGLAADHVLDPDDCVKILSHPDGALRSCPSQARVVVALTKIDFTASSHLAAAAEIADLLAPNALFEDCVFVPLSPNGKGRRIP